MILQWIKGIIRIWLLRKRFPTSIIYLGSMVDDRSDIALRTVLFKNVTLIESSLGMYSYVQANSVICHTKIGAFCSIAGNVHIGLAAHPTHFISTSPVFYDNTQPLPHFFIHSKMVDTLLPQTMIGADVWIGQGAMVKAGVTIGVGAIIGAGAMVTKDVEPYSIVAGVPAKEIRKRFDEITCKALMASKWWEFDTAKLERLAPLFTDPHAFLAALKSDNL